MDGHVYGQTKQATIISECNGGDVITLFNDGEKTGCQFDWDGRTNIVAQTGDSFAKSIYGTESDPKKHAPAYNGQVFLS